MPLARRLARGTSLPILDTGTEVIQGSNRILDWTALPSADPVLERRFEECIGPLVRRYLYAAMLGELRSPVRGMLLDGVPFWQAVLGRFVWPATRRAMIVGMDARAALVPALARSLKPSWAGSTITWPDVANSSAIGWAEWNHGGQTVRAAG